MKISFKMFLIDIWDFELIENPRLKSGGSFCANGASSFNPGQRPGLKESNGVVRPEGPR